MRIVITGAGGFLGRSLIKQLSADPQKTILALTSHPEEISSDGNLTVCGKDALFTGEQTLRREDILIHCAFPRTASGAEFAQGLDYVARILEEADRSGIRGVINISSQSVYYAKRIRPAIETDAVCPEGGYAIGKYAQELLARGICRHVPFTNVRLASLIGPGFDQRLTNKMVDFALKNGKLTVKDNQQRFGFLDVSDAVSGFCALLKLAPEQWQPIYNLGAAREYTLLELAAVVKKVVEEETGISVEILRETGTEISNSALDCYRIHQAVGYAPKESMEQSIRKILLKKREDLHIL